MKEGLGGNSDMISIRPTTELTTRLGGPFEQPPGSSVLLQQRKGKENKHRSEPAEQREGCSLWSIAEASARSDRGAEYEGDAYEHEPDGDASMQDQFVFRYER